MPFRWLFFGAAVYTLVLVWITEYRGYEEACFFDRQGERRRLRSRIGSDTCARFISKTWPWIGHDEFAEVCNAARTSDPYLLPAQDFWTFCTLPSIMGRGRFQQAQSLQVSNFDLTMAPDLPIQHQALVLESIESGFQVQSRPTPQPTHGSAVVRVLAASILSYHREIYNGERRYSFPQPLVGGSSAVGRIAVTGPDSTRLQPGQLVFVDCVMRSRDDPSSLFLTAIHEGSSNGSKKLMREVWRDGMWAEYANVPLENCIPLDEARLCRSLGYSVEDLMYMAYLLVPYGGLRDIGVEPGSTVVVCPATGGFGGAGVQVAVAMGARVIAMGRNEKELARLKEHAEKSTQGACVEVVKITGDVATDTAALQAHGTIDAVLDLSPPAAAKSTHLTSAVNALRYKGRVSLMGLVDMSASMWKVIGGDLMLKGKLMYSREDMMQFVAMLERGRFPSGKRFVDTKAYKLEEWKEALDKAAEYTGLGKSVIFTP